MAKIQKKGRRIGLLNLDWSIIWNIVNILVLFLLLKQFLFKPITKMMDSRTAEIAEQSEGR